MNQPAQKKHYINQVTPELIKSFKYKNCHQIPSLKKIVINSGISAIDEKERIKEIGDVISSIAGQRGVYILARKSISNFKLRKGVKNGFKVTLRNNNMYEFFYRLVNVVFPNLRDFRGVSCKMDGYGNYNFGIADSSIFHEINISSNKLIGMDIAFVTNAKNDKEGQELLRLMGMPFRISPTSNNIIKNEN